MSKIESVSSAQGAMHKVDELSSQRKTLSAQIKSQNEQLMDYIEQNGEIMIYDRDDKPRMFSVVHKPRTRLNKKALADHLGLKAKDINTTKVAELVAAGELDADTIAGYEEHDTVRRLKKRRANKEEIARFREVK